ncbi:phosphotransferase enzyme family protein [Nonomuraea sp. NPDC050394]|uniref:phosphotransferase enzyme family protein n=1 Tax=Nonomuraea sp. NPDC050394 TaxID=3364363 RepID=UPI0037BB98A7
MIYAVIPLTDTVRRAVKEKWGVDGHGEAVRLHGGEESAAYQLGDHVVRVGPEWRGSEETEWCHAVARHAAARMPEAVAPLATFDGATVTRVEGRPVSLWPHVQGSWPQESEQALQAARLLARLHNALSTARPGPRPIRSFAEYGLFGAEDGPGGHGGLDDPGLDRWLTEFHRTHTSRHPLHGDYYAGNTLVRGDVLTAVLDWDESFVGAPEYELAAAATEWGEDELPLVRRFADAYLDEGGTAADLDDEALAQLIRHKLRREAAYFEQSVARGVRHDQEDLDYHHDRTELFHRLRP